MMLIYMSLLVHFLFSETTDLKQQTRLFSDISGFDQDQEERQEEREREKAKERGQKKIYFEKEEMEPCLVGTCIIFECTRVNFS